MYAQKRIFAELLLDFRAGWMIILAERIVLVKLYPPLFAFSGRPPIEGAHYVHMVCTLANTAQAALRDDGDDGLLASLM